MSCISFAFNISLAVYMYLCSLRIGIDPPKVGNQPLLGRKVQAIEVMLICIHIVCTGGKNELMS